MEVKMEKNKKGEFVQSKRKEPDNMIQGKEKEAGGSLIWIVSIILIIAILHFSCSTGTATGYVGNLCKNGLAIQDILGIICCAPLYLIIIVALSGGLKFW